MLRFGFSFVVLSGFGMAQVPVGDYVRATAQDPFGPNPLPILEFVQDSGSTQRVNGLTITGLPDCVRIDPAQGDLWLSVSTSSGGELWRLEVQGADVVTETRIGLYPNPLTDLAFDEDGNVFAISAETLDQDVVSIDRVTGASTAWAGVPSIPFLLLNGLTIDGDRAWAVGRSGAGGHLLQYDLAAGPSVEPQAWTYPTTLLAADLTGPVDGKLFTAAIAPSLPGLTLWRFEEIDLSDASSKTIGFTTSVPAGLRWDRNRDLLVRQLVRLPSKPQIPASSALIFWDPVTGSVADRVPLPYRYDRSVDVNDFLDQTTVFPSTLSAPSGGTLELAGHGLPGEVIRLSVVATDGLQHAPVILGQGRTDAGGFLSVSWKVLPGQVPAGTRWSVQSDRRDTTGQWVSGSAAEVEFLP